jgi:RNA polymerase sigma factor (sigma-70 family)
MATPPREAAGRPASASDADRKTDAQLLERFLRGREEEAFAALVRRHGPMVLGVCHRLLGHAQDAEDAFQATFLVLARKAASVVPPGMVGNWLYGVACRTARKAKAAVVRRRGRERQVGEMPEPAMTPVEAWAELRPLLDRELERLPEKYRAPVVLCDLEGNTYREAALRLGWPEGTVSTRLTHARSLLARRLARCGLGLSGAALASALMCPAAVACVPGPLASSTAKAATLFAAGGAGAGAVPAAVSTLAEGVLKTMLFAKVRIVLAVVLALAVLGVGGLTYRTLADDKPGAKKEDAGKSDLEKLQGTWVVVSMESGARGKAPEEEFKGITFVIKDDRATLYQGERINMDAVIKLGPGKKPKEIDMTVNEGGKDEVHLAIYKLEGDTFTLCKSHPPEGRPTEFATKEGAKFPMVAVFKRKAAK